MPWPQHSAELRLIEWDDYVGDPSVGLILDPETGQPYYGLISVRVEVLDCPPGSELEPSDIGLEIEIQLLAFLTLESQRRDVGRLPWARLVHYEVKNQPPPHEMELPAALSDTEFSKVQDFLLDALAEGPVAERRVVAEAAAHGISAEALAEVKGRLRIASVRDLNEENPETFWRLRMAQSYILDKTRRRDSE